MWCHCNYVEVSPIVEPTLVPSSVPFECWRDIQPKLYSLFRPLVKCFGDSLSSPSRVVGQRSDIPNVCVCVSSILSPVLCYAVSLTFV